MPQALAVVGAVTSVVGTVASISAQNRAANAQEKQQELASRRSRRQAIREMQIRRAQAIQSSIGTGSAFGSGFSGGIGALSSQLGSEMGYASQQSALSGVVTDASRRAGMWSGIASLGTAAFNAGGGFSAFQRPPQQQQLGVPDYTRGM